MRAGRCLRGIVAALVAVSLSPSSLVTALETTRPPVEYYSPVFITAFQTSYVPTTDPIVPTPTTKLDVIELYNSSDEPINMNGWSVNAYATSGQVCSVVISSDDIYIPLKGYVVISEVGTFSDTNVLEFMTSCLANGVSISKLEFVSPSRVEETINGIVPGAYVRKGLTATYRDEDDAFLDNFTVISSRPNSAVYAGSWYVPLDITPIQISEILAHSRDCSPLEVALDCTDYVKLYNPTSGPVDLTGLRLRIGYKGQNVTDTNAIVLGGVIDSDSYGLIAKKADGGRLAITDSGGWIWLEDTYGLKTYDGTVVEYPSASSTTKIGWAWAYNEATGQWQWTSTPTPTNQPSVFTEPAEPVVVKSPSAVLKPCRSDQVRNRETNRCKNIVSSSAASLAPCKENQTRNPLTNRCRSLDTVATSELKPCAANQERNPETNRCRSKPAVLAATDFPIETVKDAPEGTLGWWAFAGVGSMAAGYAGWEWRRELATLAKAFGSLFRR